MSGPYEVNLPQNNGSSFRSLSDEDFQTHCRIKRYGDFNLSDAVVPSYDLRIIPQEGYSFSKYRDPESQTTFPLIYVSPSAEKFFELFYKLLELPEKLDFGTLVDVYLKYHQNFTCSKSVEFHAPEKEDIIVASMVSNYEDLIINDGCSGISVKWSDSTNQKFYEIQVDAHKVFLIYSSDSDAVVEILGRLNIKYISGLKTIDEAEHVHLSSDKYTDLFGELCGELGAEIYQPNQQLD